jgi:hypothetical protein
MIKFTIKLFFLLILAVNIQKISAEEYRTVLFNSSERPLLLNPGEKISVDIKLSGRDYPTTKMIRVTGGTLMPGDFKSRGESNFRKWEYYIDDYLDSIHVSNDKYSLLFSGRNEEFPRKAYYRISEQEIKAGETKISVRVKRNDFSCKNPEDFGIELELFYEKEGRSKHDIYDPPDSLVFMTIPAGEGPYEKMEKTFNMPANVAAVLVVAGGSRFSGDCFMEAPRISQNGKEIFNVPFVKHAGRNSDFNYWVGCNMVSRNWSRWILDIDGREIFNDRIFDRASNVADFYIPLPEEVGEGENLTLILADEPEIASFPYEISTIEIIEQPADDLEIISEPRFILANKEFGLLIETRSPGLQLSYGTTSGIEPAVDEQVIKTPGLHVIKFRTKRPGIGDSIIIHYGEKSKVVDIGQIIAKNDDNVYLSVGDDIYIDMVDPYYSHYFKWYVNQRIGNFFQFRPSYQWSGLRDPDPAIVKKYLGLLRELNMPYAWQVEGRTLAGSELNPPVEKLRTPVFQGKQAHENDGGYYYWRHFHYQGLFSDMAARTRPYGGIFAKHRPIYTDNGVFIHYDPYKVTDMRDGADYFVNNLNYSKGESTRHTGPSSLFRYLYQAGYDWLGAEQMYGPEETILSSLRGASGAYKRNEYGSLHAMQWGSHPYTDPKHAHRFYLSLATAYMHGSSHINTEDALWIDEYANDRFSESGREHIKVQNKMLDFIQTHERRGDQVIDIALIQGRNCAWKSFGRTPLWSQRGEKWEFNKATESFDLINVFYPQNIINACGPDGWFTSTPFGAIDLLPVEADKETFKKYKTIIFLGWNTYNEKDLERLKNYVSEGGTLILSAAHLNVELDPDIVPRFPEDDTEIKELLGSDYRQLKEKAEINYGKGKVIYFPQAAYPAEESIREPYQDAMKEEGMKSTSSRYPEGWITPDDKVSFTVWDDNKRRTIYILNIDWSAPDNRAQAKFHLGNSVYEIQPRSYVLETIHIRDDVAVMPEANTTDILSVEPTGKGWEVTVQTTGKDNLHFFRGDKNFSSAKKIDSAGIHLIKIDRM